MVSIMTRPDPGTPLKALAYALRRASRHNADVECAPHCILWPDRESQWRPIIPALQAVLPELLVFGEYNEQLLTGPAIWLRCALAGEVPAFQPSPIMTPIIYLPGVGRQDLRAVENCPEHLQPLAELQYRGAIWSQVNAKDWTLLAFLKSDQGGLGLDVSLDRDAKSAMLLASGHVMDEPLDLLRSKRLDAAYFNTLLTGGDPIRDLLQWMDAPGAFRNARDANEWAAFENVCQSQFAFRPQDGELAAAGCLAGCAGPWALIWQRYCEAPRRYPHIPDLIRRAQAPVFDLLADADSAGGWPQWNAGRENELRSDMLAIAKLTPHEAREKLQLLEDEHHERRDLVWAELGEAPLALALGHLAELARITSSTLAAGELQDLQAAYSAEGWRADDAVLLALEQAKSAMAQEAITTAIRSVYLPWAEESARHLQKLVAHNQTPGGVCEPSPPQYIAKDQCVLFVDGLRYDAAKRLVNILERAGQQVEEHQHWAALPSVTATGKAAVCPVAHQITGDVGEANFEPRVLDGDSKLSSYQLKKLLKEANWDCLNGHDVGAGSGQAWCEFGDIDHEGHGRGWKLAQHLDAMLAEISERINALLGAGWVQVRVVTDHGWLLMPGGLPKIELPKALADTKWGRCAAIKPGAKSAERLFPWYWNPDQSFALADGIACYKKGDDYAHGGLSLQECLTLQLTVTRTKGTSEAVNMTDVAWKGLRLAVAVEEGWDELAADIRLQAGDPESSVAVSPKPFKSNGTSSLIVEEEDLEGQPAFLVIVNKQNNLLAQRSVTIGGEK